MGALAAALFVACPLAAGAGNVAAVHLADVAGAPPTWVMAGQRISYYVAAASVAQSSFAWVEDPNGDWEDPVTGQRYRRTDESGEGVATASGDGYSMFDIGEVGATTVTGTNTIFAINRTTTPPLLVAAGSFGTTVGAAIVDGLWINPATLAAFRVAPPAGLLVLAGPYELSGTTYDSIAFASRDPAAYSSYTYDSATGLLLVATTRTAGATSPVSAAGEDPPVGNTQLTYTQLLGVRQRAVPGLGGSNPPWVASTPRLHYRGTYSISNPLDLSLGALTSPLTTEVVFGAAAGTWTPFTATTTVSILGSPTTQTGVAGPSGPYWIDPAALATLATGQELDRDPITGGTLTVTAADAETITITDAVPGFEVTSVYRRDSGVLSAFEVRNPPSGTIHTAALETTIA